jgi:hypothetical protein
VSSFPKLNSRQQYIDIVPLSKMEAAVSSVLDSDDSKLPIDEQSVEEGRKRLKLEISKTPFRVAALSPTWVDRH